MLCDNSRRGEVRAPGADGGRRRRARRRAAAAEAASVTRAAAAPRRRDGHGGRSRRRALGRAAAGDCPQRSAGSCRDAEEAARARPHRDARVRLHAPARRGRARPPSLRAAAVRCPRPTAAGAGRTVSRGARALPRCPAPGLPLRRVRARRGGAHRRAAAPRPRAQDRRGTRARAPRRRRSPARATDRRGAPARAVPGAADARAVPRGPAGRGARGIPARALDPRRRARHRAGARAAAAGAPDSQPGSPPCHPLRHGRRRSPADAADAAARARARAGRSAAARFPDGVFFVPLASLADPELVVPTLASALGVGETAGTPLEQLIADRIGDRPTLVVLDNVEHVAAAASGVGTLLSAAAGLKLLATSREPLRLYGEHLYRVPPLENAAATALFCDRAEAVGAIVDRGGADLAAVAEICLRLDRLPLAVELAAARADVLPLEALVARLGERLELLTKGPVDQPPRLQTLRRTLDWSAELLAPEERDLFARLSVFAGGWTLEAAEAVCGDDDVIERLAALVDKSLVQLPPGDAEPRQAMLETVREYARELLEHAYTADEPADRHVGYFLMLAEQAEPHLRGAPGQWLDRLELEEDNLRAALDRLEARGEARLLQRLAGALWRFWYLRGRLGEGRRRLEQALAAGEAATPARAEALIGAAVMAVNTGDEAAATARAEEAIAVADALGDRWSAAYATFMLGNLAPDRLRACALYNESIRAFRTLGDEHSALLATRHLAFAREALGEPAEARALHEQNLARARSTANQRMEASSLGALADYAMEEERVDQAIALLRHSLRIHRELGDVLDTGVDLCRLAAALAAAGDAVTAARLLASFAAVPDEVSRRRLDVDQLNDKTTSRIRAQLSDAAFGDACAEGREITLAQAVDLALDGRV